MKDKSWKAKKLFSRFPMMQLSVPSGGSRMRSNVRAAAHKRMSDIELYLRNLFSQPNEIRQVIPFAFQILTIIFTLDVFFHRNSLLLYYCSLYGMVLIRFLREWSSSITIQEWCCNTWNFWKKCPNNFVFSSSFSFKIVWKFLQKSRRRCAICVFVRKTTWSIASGRE